MGQKEPAISLLCQEQGQAAQGFIAFKANEDTY